MTMHMDQDPLDEERVAHEAGAPEDVLELYRAAADAVGVPAEEVF